MAPIADTPFKAIEESSAWIVVLSVLAGVYVVCGLIVTAIVCACGKKKHDEAPPTDQQVDGMPQQLPKMEPAYEPAVQHPEEQQQSLKMTMDAHSRSKTQKSVTSEDVKNANSLRLMSKLEKEPDNRSTIFPSEGWRAAERTLTNQPSLALMGSTVKPGRSVQPGKSEQPGKSTHGQTTLFETSSVTVSSVKKMPVAEKSKSIQKTASKARGGMPQSMVSVIGKPLSVASGGSSIRSRSVAPPSPSEKQRSISVGAS